MKINIDNFTYFDTETTGVKYNQDKLVSVYCENKKKGWYLDSLTNPEIDIPESASNVHGITNDLVVDKPTNDVVLKSLLKIFDNSKVICGYNILRFDIPLIKNLCNSQNISFDEKSYSYVDVYYLLRIALSEEEINKIGPLKLGNVYKHITGKELTNAHDASVDVKATKKILKWILKNYDVSDCLILNYEYLMGSEVTESYKFFTGKYENYTVKELMKSDMAYLEFLKKRNHLKFDPSLNIK